ncbi:hypothetical protein [Dongshaea marina]|uniref:hypothetical protein n=1 Tax=Dongshaea marina TaxID=2047966 RepID=UPI000D3E991D|nr:hypothetical protein [Dongshaea marina]
MTKKDLSVSLLQRLFSLVMSSLLHGAIVAVLLYYVAPSWVDLYSYWLFGAALLVTLVIVGSDALQSALGISCAGKGWRLLHQGKLEDQPVVIARDTLGRKRVFVYQQGWSLPSGSRVTNSRTLRWLDGIKASG